MCSNELHLSSSVSGTSSQFSHPLFDIQKRSQYAVIVPWVNKPCITDHTLYGTIKTNI